MDKMDLHYLEIFNAVAQDESYTKASELLHISQPALSVQIKKLEAQIGLKLFEKAGNKVHLTEHGQMLQEYTKRIFSIVQELDDIISETQNFVGGVLQIGGSNTPGTYIMPEVIGAFKQRYPGIKVNLHIANTSEISFMVNNGSLDVAVNGGSEVYPDAIFVKKLYQDKLILVASDKNELTNQTSITRSDIERLDFVVHKTDSQLYTYYKRFLKELEIEEKVSMYLGNIDAIKRAVASNLGVALIPYEAVKYELKFGILKEINYKGFQNDYPYHLIYNKTKVTSAAGKKFIDFLQNNFTTE